MWVSSHPLSFGIERGLAVDEEQVLVMAMMENDLQKPGTVRASLQWVSAWGPLVKIAYQADLVCLGGMAEEANGALRVLSRVARRGPVRLRSGGVIGVHGWVDGGGMSWGNGANSSDLVLFLARIVLFWWGIGVAEMVWAESEEGAWLSAP